MSEESKCHDCGVAVGQLHTPGCDKEICPCCGGQAIGCNCVYEKNGIDINEFICPKCKEEGDCDCGEEAVSKHPDVYEKGPTKEMYEKFDVMFPRRIPYGAEAEVGFWSGKSMQGAEWNQAKQIWEKGK